MPGFSCRRRAPPLLLAAALAAGGCRRTGEQNVREILPNAAGANGCNTSDHAFAGAPAAVALQVLAIGLWSQVTAAADAELLFATGADATVVEIDVADPAQPVERELVAAGAVAALYATLGIAEAPELSGIAVLDESTLIVVEHAANVLLAVGRLASDQVELFAGQPNPVPGSADGRALGTMELARFSFEAPCQIAPTGAEELEVFIADSGNHSLRLLTGGQVVTLAGPGFPFLQDGSFAESAFDTPSGLTITCGDRLLVSELGDFGYGQLLRQVSLFESSSFSLGFEGTVETLVGDGMDATSGGSAALDPTGTLAQTSRPVSPLATAGGEVYWIDSGTGVLRRLAGGIVDCPLSADCASALEGTPFFTPGGLCTITATPSGRLYVLDADAATLFAVP